MAAAWREWRPARLVMCCDAAYESIAREFPEVDDVLPIDFRILTSVLRGDTDLPDAMSEMLRIVGASQSFDIVLNLTNHGAAWQFAKSTGAARCLGYGAAGSQDHNDGGFGSPGLPFGPQHISSVWSAFIVNANQPVPRSLNTSRSVPSKSGVAILCDAGESERDLTADLLDRIIEAVQRAGIGTITLLGARSANNTFSTLGCLRDLRGQTSLLDLKRELGNSVAVIGPDTGGLHFAAALGKPVFGIYLAGAREQLTGPLSHRCHCLQAMTAAELTPVIQDELDAWLMKLSTSTTLDHIAATSDAWSMDVSIVIPEHAQTYYADVLLRQLAQWRPTLRAEVIVVSGGLDSLDLSHARARSQVVVDAQCEVRTFAQACNRGSLMARGAWLLFLNDDCELTLENLDQLLSERVSGKIIGPRLRDWDGELQAAGFHVSRRGVIERGGAGEQCELDGGHVHGLSAAAMLIEHDLFDDLGGFADCYRNGYEDVDLCLRASERGIAMHVANADIMHYRGSAPERYHADNSNAATLRNRWEDRLRGDASGIAIQNGVGCPIVIVSDEHPHSAGAVLRWRSPLTRIGLRENRDFVWLHAITENTAQVAGILGEAKVLVVFRSISDPALRELVLTTQRQRNLTLCFDADDILLDRFPAGSRRSVLRADFERGVREIAAAATTVTAPNAAILANLTVRASRTHVIPSLSMSEHFSKPLLSNDASCTRIGYAGGKAHALDLALVTPVIEDILEQNERTFFYWWGAHPGPIAYHPQVRRGGSWQSNYMRHLARLTRAPIDLWLVPLAESRSNAARSPIKAFEYIGAMRPCLFSQVSPFSDLLSDSAPGLLVDNTHAAWRSAIESWLFSSDRSRRLEQLLAARTRIQLASQDTSAYESFTGNMLKTRRESLADHVVMA